jgi:hypothetical protein
MAYVDGIRPFSHGMQQGGTCCILQISDFLLTPSILKVSIDTAKSQLLILILAVIFEKVILKAAIVCMVLLYLDTVRQEVGFESIFSPHRFLGGRSDLKVHIRIVAVLINKDHSIPISSFRQYVSLQLTDKTRCH